MDNNIIREQTPEERVDFIDISNKDKEGAKSKFYKQLTDNEQKAIKNIDKDGCPAPFATQVAINDFNDYYEMEVRDNIRRNGYLIPEQVKPIKMDWAKYSDLKNFELIETIETSDENLSKHNPGLNVKMKCKVYRFKGYNNRYYCSEDGPSAILRARRYLKDLEKDTK